MTRVGPMDSPVVGGTIVSTLTRGWITSHRNKSLVNQLGNNWDASARRKVVVSPAIFHHVQLGVSCHINDNYCVSAPVLRWLTRSKKTVKWVSLCQLHRTGSYRQNRRETVNLDQCHQRHIGILYKGSHKAKA